MCTALSVRAPRGTGVPEGGGRFDAQTELLAVPQPTGIVTQLVNRWMEDKGLRAEEGQHDLQTRPRLQFPDGMNRVSPDRTQRPWSSNRKGNNFWLVRYNARSAWRSDKSGTKRANDEHHVTRMETAWTHESGDRVGPAIMAAMGHNAHSKS